MTVAACLRSLGLLLGLSATPLLGQGTESAPLSRPAPSADRAAVRDLVERRLAGLWEYGTFAGASLALSFGAGEDVAIAGGYADREKKRLLRPSDRMMQGSVGKTYVSAVALALIDEKKLSLDDRVGTHLASPPLPERIPNFDRITIRDLLRHTSGIDRYEFKPSFLSTLNAAPERTFKPAELLAFVAGDPPLSEPGARFHYADTNYILLGLVLEKVGGEALFAAIARRLLLPLGLEDTVAALSPSIPRLAQGYAGEKNEFGKKNLMLENDRMIVNPQFEWAGGGFASTAKDLARWARELYAGRGLSRAARLALVDGVAAPMLGKGARYGLGVILRDTPQGQCLGHSGFFPGYMTEMRYYTDLDLALAVQVNTSIPADLPQPLGAFLGEIAAEVAALQKVESDR